MSDIVKQFFYALGLFLLCLAAEMSLAKHIDVTWNEPGETAEHSQHRFVITTPMAYASLTAGTVLCLYCFIIPRRLRRIRMERELEKTSGGRYDGYGDQGGYDWLGKSSTSSSGYDDFSVGLQKNKTDKDDFSRITEDGDEELSVKELAKIKRLLKTMRSDR